MKGSFTEQPFFSLLCDAIHHIHLAKENTHTTAEARHARSAVLNSVVLLEAAANCCLESLLNGEFKKEADRLQGLMSKFDLYLRIRAGALLDRNRVECKAIKELVERRNRLVHGHAATHKTISSTKSSSEAEPPTINIYPSYSPLLNISDGIMLWDHSVAVRALQASAAFLKYVLGELAQMTPDQTFSLLVSRFEVENYGSGPVVDSDASEYVKVATEWGCDFSFLRISEKVSPPNPPSKTGVH